MPLPPGMTAEVGEEYLRFIGASYTSHGRTGDAADYLMLENSSFDWLL